MARMLALVLPCHGAGQYFFTHDLEMPEPLDTECTALWPSVPDRIDLLTAFFSDFGP